jgi:hypothetical protein
VRKVLGILTVLVFCLVSCSLDDAKYNVFDNNNAIANNKDKYLQKSSSRNNAGNAYSHQANSFTGLKTIRAINGNQVFFVNLSISSGRFKLVLVDGDDVIMICDENVNKSFEFRELTGKKCTLKIVGDVAAFDLGVTF